MNHPIGNWHPPLPPADMNVQDWHRQHSPHTSQETPSALTNSNPHVDPDISNPSWDGLDHAMMNHPSLLEAFRDTDPSVIEALQRADPTLAEWAESMSNSMHNNFHDNYIGHRHNNHMVAPNMHQHPPLCSSSLPSLDSPHFSASPLPPAITCNNISPTSYRNSLGPLPINSTTNSTPVYNKSPAFSAATTDPSLMAGPFPTNSSSVDSLSSLLTSQPSRIVSSLSRASCDTNQSCAAGYNNDDHDVPSNNKTTCMIESVIKNTISPSSGSVQIMRENYNNKHSVASVSSSGGGNDEESEDDFNWDKLL